MSEIAPAVPLLSVTELSVEYGNPKRGGFRALHGASLDIGAGQCVGLVGESGSGKSTLGKAILGLVPVSGGTISFDGRDITKLTGRTRRELASQIQVVFQDPYGSLNPRMTIGDILAEPLLTSGIGTRSAETKVREMLDRMAETAEARDDG